MVIAARSTPIVLSSAASKNERARADRRARALERQRQDDLTVLSQYRRCLRPDYLECREVSKIINASLMAARTVYRKSRESSATIWLPNCVCQRIRRRASGLGAR